MQRYFVKNKEDDIITLSDEDNYHITKVMRMNLKDKVELVYQNELYIGEIESLSPVTCRVLEKQENKEKTIPNVIIAQSLVKEQKMDYILQKSCELGVSEIIPISTSRSIIKRDKDDNKKILRWNKILKEASEQSKRCDIPKLEKVLDIKDLINLSYDHKFLCSVNEKAKSIKSVLSNTKISDTILFVIGPEGGFTENEEKLLIDNGFVSITFGSNVLRTETASSFILSSINYEFMR